MPLVVGRKPKGLATVKASKMGGNERAAALLRVAKHLICSWQALTREEAAVIIHVGPHHAAGSAPSTSALAYHAQRFIEQPPGKCAIERLGLLAQRHRADEALSFLEPRGQNTGMAKEVAATAHLSLMSNLEERKILEQGAADSVVVLIVVAAPVLVPAYVAEVVVAEEQHYIVGVQALEIDYLDKRRHTMPGRYALFIRIWIHVVAKKDDGFAFMACHGEAPEVTSVYVGYNNHGAKD